MDTPSVKHVGRNWQQGSVLLVAGFFKNIIYLIFEVFRIILNKAFLNLHGTVQTI